MINRQIFGKILTAVFLALVCTPALGQDAAPAPAPAQPAPPQIGTIEYQNSTALIQNFIVVVNAQAVRYNLTGASESGVKALRIVSGEHILVHKECYGGKTCQASGVSPLTEVANGILTISVTDSANAEQKEKLRISPEQGGEKVYMITALPAFSGDQPLVIAGGGPTETATGTVTTPPPTEDDGQIGNPIEVSGDKGPVITLSIDKASSNEFGFTILSTDSMGVDFIEILENGSFLDVELCGGSKQCTMKKAITLSDPGEYTYIIKVMNKNGKISFQEEHITVE